MMRFAWRSLRRTPVFTTVAVLTLVIGIAAVTAIFAVLNGVVLRPLPYGKPDRLVGAWYELPGVNIKRGTQTAATYFTNIKLAKTITGMGVYQDGSINVSDPTGATQPQRITNAWISSTLIPVLQVQPLLGRNFTEAEDLPNGPPVVIISEGLWRSRFGADRNVIGKTLEVSGRQRQIVGVMPERFRFPTAETQLWLPTAIDPAAQYAGGFKYFAIARLKPGVTIDAAQRELESLIPRVSELFPMVAPNVPWKWVVDQAKPHALLVPLKDDVTSDIAGTLWMVFAAAGLVLLVACANVSNLMLVRADARQRELAVREALGAGRGRIMSSFLSEAVLLSAIAGAIALFLSWIAVRALVAKVPFDVPRLAEVKIDVVSVVVSVAVSALVSVVCTVIPALRLGRLHLSNALREGGRSGTAGKAQQRVRGALVVAQIALALVMLAGSALLLRTFQRLKAVHPGFNADNVLTMRVSLPPARYRTDTAVVHFYASLTDRVGKVPGVVRVGLSSRLPLTRYSMNQDPFFPEGDATYNSKIPPLQIVTTTDSGYFGAMGIPLIAGRTFNGLIPQPEHEAIISRKTAIQFYKDSTGVSALGKRFTIQPGGPKYTIIGVVGDARDTTLSAPPSQTIYFPEAIPADANDNQTENTMALVVKTSVEPNTLITPIQKVIRELDQTLPTLDVLSMPSILRASTARLSFIILILGAAAAVTLILGVVGLYGVMAYVVTLRTKELGVRIALGAQPSSVAAMMTRQGLTLTVAGVVAGLALFAGVSRFLGSFLYDTAPTDPVALGGASLTLVVVAALASFVPARRAARVDPVETLRAE